MGGTGATKTVTNAELGDTLTACNTYTLTINANNVSAKSEYGDPNTNNYGSKTQTYQVNINDYKVCYAKPASMTVNTWCSTANCAYPSGYNANVFVPNLGFIPKSTATSPTTNTIANFPTSGFHGAKFQLMMSNNQSDYTYSVTQGGGLASVDVNDGTVTFDQVGVGNSLPSDTTVKIKATPKPSIGAPAVTYEFEVKKSQWARVKGLAQYNTVGNFTGTYPAAELCGAPTGVGQLTGKAGHYGIGKASSYFFSRSDFTKSPITDITDRFDVNAGAIVPAGGSPKTGGGFSRDINGKFNDEWGNLYISDPYSGSGFGAHRSVWTAEAYFSNLQFLVFSSNGLVSGGTPNFTYVTVCR